MASRKMQSEPECTTEEFEQRQSQASIPVDLNGIIEETESGLSLSDFEPAEVVRAASFDPKTEDGSRLWWRAMNENHIPLEGRGDFTTKIRDWVCYQTEVTRRTGEVDSHGWVTVWFLDNGETLSTASTLTARKWANAVKAIKASNAQYPVTVHFKAYGTNVKGKQPWYSILPAKDS